MTLTKLEALLADDKMLDIIAIGETPTETNRLTEILIGWRNEIREGENYQYSADSYSRLARLWLASRT